MIHILELSMFKEHVSTVFLKLSLSTEYAQQWAHPCMSMYMLPCLINVLL